MPAKRAEPNTLSRSLVKAMDHERLALVETTWVPDRYSVRIDAQDWQHLKPIAAEVRQQLLELLEERIRNKDYRLLTERIELELGEGMTPPGEPFAIQCAFTRQDAPSRPSAPRPATQKPAPQQPATKSPRETPTPSAPLMTAELKPRTPPAPTQPPRTAAPTPPPAHKRHPPAEEPLITGEIFPPGYKHETGDDSHFNSNDRLPLVDSGHAAKDPDTKQLQESDPFLTGPIDIPADLRAADSAGDFQFDSLDEPDAPDTPNAPPDQEMRMSESPPSGDDEPIGGAGAAPGEGGHRETMMISRLHEAPTMHMSSDELQNLMGAESARGGPYFQEFVDDKPGRKLPLAGVELVVGRGEVDIVSPVTDGLISRRHAVLSTDPRGRWRVKDISVNGMKVNSRPVKETILKDGDTIEVGRWKLEFHNPSTESDA